MSDLPLLAPMPLGDGPKRAHRRMRLAIAAIARRVALKALVTGSDDVLAAVYSAGVFHGATLERERAKAQGGDAGEASR